MKTIDLFERYFGTKAKNLFEPVTQTQVMLLPTLLILAN